MEKFGNLFLRATTVVYLVSDNPARSVVPMAENWMRNLKNQGTRKARNRKERPVHDISPEDAGTYREF